MSDKFEKKVYIEIPHFTPNEGNEILSSNNKESKILYLISLGKYCEDYEYSIKILEEYLNNKDEDLVIIALQSLNHLVYNTEKIELSIIKEIVKFLQSSNTRIYEYAEDLLLEISMNIPKYRKLANHILKDNGSKWYKEEYL